MQAKRWREALGHLRLERAKNIKDKLCAVALADHPEAVRGEQRPVDGRRFAIRGVLQSMSVHESLRRTPAICGRSGQGRIFLMYVCRSIGQNLSMGRSPIRSKKVWRLSHRIAAARLYERRRRHERRDYVRCRGQDFECVGRIGRVPEHVGEHIADECLGVVDEGAGAGFALGDPHHFPEVPN